MTPPEGPLELTVRPGQLARGLGVVVLVLVAVGLVANRLVYAVAPHVDHPLARAAARFDLGLEPSLPALWSSGLLAACALLLALNGRASPLGERGTWYGLAIVFVALAVDETVMIHEMANDTLHEALGTSGPLYFAWVIPGALFTLAVALGSTRFLLRRAPRTRRLFVTAGALFVGGAIGMELLAGVIVEDHGAESVGHMLEQAVEESLEMTGAIVFLYALSDRLGRTVDSVRIRVPTNGAREA